MLTYAQVAGMSVAQLREEIKALGGCIDGCYERRFSIKALLGSIKALSRLCSRSSKAQLRWVR